MQHAWTCRCCGRQFEYLPLDFACTAPDYWFGISEAERDVRGKLDSDVCFADEHIFVRGCLEIPLLDNSDKFVWGLWVSVSRKNFDRIAELWSAPIIEAEPPKFGWLSNNISIYPPTLSLKTNLHLRSGGLRPYIELEPTDHPLAVEQRQGILLSRVEEIATTLLLRH